MNVIQNSNDRVKVYFDAEMKRSMYEGTKWKFICDNIVKELPQNVYISFDIDGLDPKLCPHTGTPVPGGLEFAEAAHVVELVARSGRKIVGFDLVEVSPSPDRGDEWDANVGMRLLYKLAAWTLVSRGLRSPRD